MYLAGTGAVQSFGLQEQKYLQDTSSKAAQLQTLEFQLKDLESGKKQQEMQSQVRLAELQTQLQGGVTHLLLLFLYNVGILILSCRYELHE